jgi:hypothetical protein
MPKSASTADTATCGESHTAREKHSLDAFLVVTAHESRVVEVTLLSSLFLGQNVTVVGMLSLNLTSAGESEAFLGTRFSL